MEDLRMKLEMVVRKYCATRDESHGTQHMIDVANNASIILKSEEITDYQIKRVVMAGAMFHDIADHKYVSNPVQIYKELTKYLIGFDFTYEEANTVILICENVSYSREVKGLYDPKNMQRYFDWGILARDIVSDADKLEAIGMRGVERCYEYNIETNPLATLEEIDRMVEQHYREKLIHLKDGYIRTKSGRLLAEPHHNIMEGYFS